MRWVPLLVATLAWPAAARADRALTPGDVRAGGVVEVGTALGRTARDLDWSDAAGGHDTRATELVAGFALRAWFGPWLSLGVEQSAALDRAARTDGSAEMLATERGLHDLELDLRASRPVGPVRLGVIARASLPTGSDGIQSTTADVAAGGFGAWQAHAAVLGFATLDYELHAVSDSHRDVGDTLRAAAGAHGRLGRWSLVPRVELAHTRAVPELETDGYLTIRTDALLAFEPRADLVLDLRLGWARAERHALGGDLAAGADDLSIAFGLRYAWDLTPLRRHRSSPSPAAIELQVAHTDAGEPDAIDRALGSRIPTLRMSTLRAEMDNGGARGDIRLVMDLDEDGAVATARVEDATGNAALAEEVRRFFLGTRLPAGPGRLEVLLTFR